jgi:dTDP-4-amino-4,6-dideoxygalactose transaminase
LKVPLLDLKRQYQQIQEEVLAVTHEVLKSQQFILGPKVNELEERIAEYCGCRYAVGVSSGTDALLISLMTADVGPGDLVITTPYTFFATVGAIARVGASPVFVDIEGDTYNLDPAEMGKVLSSLEEREKARLRAIIPVHLFGQCADMEPLLEAARAHRLTVIEDAAQAIGAEYGVGSGPVKRAGSMGDFGCFSFYPTKNLGAAGEAGLVTTQDQSVYERLKIMRNHGDVERYKHQYIGGNFRLDAIQAAILLVKLKYLDVWTKERQAKAGLYRKVFREKDLRGVSLPREKQKRHTYNQFVIRVESERDALKNYLKAHGVGCEVYYPTPLHIQACFSHLGYRREDFPVSVEAAEKTLALPIYPELSEEQIAYVVDMIDKFFRKGR